MANRYNKALKHLKNKNIDEKLQLLSEIPTNHTTGLYVDVPGTLEPPEIVPGDLPLDQGLNLVEDGQGQEGYTGNDTTGLFLADGTIKSVEPPGDTSYILGPMMSMWYAWANYTQIGYVRQSDRKMVNLGRITGEMSAWDGETGFTGYGQLSLEQAVWFKGQTRADYRAFYPGPPSNPADEYGRYIGSMISSSKSITRIDFPDGYWKPGTNRGFNASDDHALAMDRGGAALGIGLVIWMGIEGGKMIKNIIDNLTPEQQDRLFDRSISMFGDTNAAGMAAEANIGNEMAMIRDRPGESPYNIQWPRKPGQKTKPGPGARPSNQPMGPKLPLATNQQDTIIAHHILSGRFIREQASGGGTITAHTDAGDVTITIPSTPPMPPEDNKGMQTTPESGVATDYSKQQLNWLKGQESEYFVAGFVKGTAEDPARLEKMFAGTTVSWTRVTSMVSEINEMETARDEAQKLSLEIWDEVSPQITSLLNRINALPDKITYSVFYGTYMPMTREIDRLFDLHDDQVDVTARLTEQWLGMNGRLGRYVQSGKLVDMDPFKLNDPTIKKEKELDEKEISDIINQLKKENSELQRRILLNKLKMFGMGALLAAGAIIGFKLLTGAAAVKTLGVPVVSTIKRLAPQVTKVTRAAKPFQNASDDFIRAITSPKTMSRANDVLKRTPSGFKNDVAIDVKVGGATQRVKAADILKYKGFQINSHQPSGKLLTESQKKVLRNIKKPVQVKEIPSKVKVSPKLRNKTVGADMMKTLNAPNQFKPPAPNIWASKDRKANIRSSQEKKNEVLELVGAAEHHWTYMTEDSKKQKQERINEMMSAEFDKQLEMMYEQHRIKENKLNKTISAFRKPTDIKPEYPETPPPEPDPETGMHPKYGKRYKHDKLDPQSAEAMPPTGNPEIDANIKKATNQKEKARKLKIIFGKKA